MRASQCCLAFGLLVLISMCDGVYGVNSSAKGVTKCCNWRTNPKQCGIGVCTKQDCQWLCTEACRCGGPGWMPASWSDEISAGSLLPASPDEPGGTIGNGYVGVWVPRGLPGSAGNPVCGQEHVKGVFAGSAPIKGYPNGSDIYTVSLAPLASWTATSYISSIGDTKLPATTSAMDLRRAAYRVASKAHDVECVQTIYAHRDQQHLIVSEFDCINNGTTGTTVLVKQGRCNPIDPVDDYIYETLCPQVLGGRHGYTRKSQPVTHAGVTCSLSTMDHSETPSMPIPLLGECHTDVPAQGLELWVPPDGVTHHMRLISSRHSNMDQGPAGNTTTDPVTLAINAWLAANRTAHGTLLAGHVDAMDNLHRHGIEVLGNLELAQVVNASIHALLSSYRDDSPYSSAPEGLISTRYSGHAFWDVETWQWPTWLAFWPSQARAALQYRAELMGQARLNAKEYGGDIFLHDWPDNDQHKPSLDGLRYPWESALAGVEQCVYNSEDHIVGDIATAFRQYWRATQDVSWLQSSGYPVIKGIATFYASRVSAQQSGAYHMLHTQGPDEYHGNITDSAYGNSVAKASLMSAYELASIVGQAPNETFREIANRLTIPYNVTVDYHPEYDQTQWNARAGQLIKQADTVLMYYPLGVNSSTSTRLHDVRIYGKLQDPQGVAMTWGIQSIVSLDIGDLNSAAEYFYKGFRVYARAPFYTWHEGNGTDGSSSQGAPNLVTGAGGFLQNVWAGYGGVRYDRDDALTLRSPRPLPNSTGLILRGVYYLGARLDINARQGNWIVALSESCPANAPQLELVMESGTPLPAIITHTPLVRSVGQVGFVRQVGN